MLFMTFFIFKKADSVSGLWISLLLAIMLRIQGAHPAAAWTAAILQTINVKMRVFLSAMRRPELLPVIRQYRSQLDVIVIVV